MSLCHSFPPAGANDPRILILGSMPGQVSLQKNQYYAHPQNCFWKIMGELFGATPRIPYEERLSLLAAHRVTLWESLQSCIRPGSADAAIIEEIPNDFNSFFKTRRNVSHIFFDGAKAYQSFQKLVLPGLQKTDLILTPLPSTSPRHAGMTYAEKLEQWRVISKALAL